jgi:hypothetical protein
VHKKSIHVCIRTGKGKKLEVLTGVFGTFTADLEQLREFLQVLERGDWSSILMLVDPQHVRALKGEKTHDRSASCEICLAVAATCKEIATV